jgi:hypothetical protein
MNLKSQMRALNQPEENVQGLKGLIGWFNQSSLEQIQEYRRLEEWADYLKEQRESIREPRCRDRKISRPLDDVKIVVRVRNRSFVSPGPRCLWS